MSKPDKPLDRIDFLILDCLQQNSDISNVELAEKINLSPPPCLERVKRLRQAGYIEKCVAILNPYALNVGLLAYIQVTLHSTATKELDIFNRAVELLDQVQECHMVSGGFDYLIKVRVSDMQAYRDFLGNDLANIENVRETHTYVVMQEVKSEHSIDLQYAKKQMLKG